MMKFSIHTVDEIHTVDSPFNKDPKNLILSREALISGEGWPENLRRMGNNIVMEIGGW